MKNSWFISSVISLCISFSFHCGKNGLCSLSVSRYSSWGLQCFLPAKDKDFLMLYTNCCGKCCTADDLCVDCHDWTDEKWDKVSVYHEKLAIQREKMKERKNSLPSLVSLAFHYLLSCLYSYWTYLLARLIMQLPTRILHRMCTLILMLLFSQWCQQNLTLLINLFEILMSQAVRWRGSALVLY